MTDAARDKEFIEYVVKMLVDHPDKVKVDRKIDEMGVLITLDVDQEDMGMVIGREGMTAKALRTLLRVIGARNNARVNLKINEPEGSTRVRREPVAEPMATPAEAAPAQSVEPTAPAVPRTFEDVMNDIKI
ncbi:MAG: KH domain-containing protein [Candidatus Moraniibacteriota bacterium]|nr:MAG: KH domain-containing protein [Candidatus Moranbacteria bacterium]